MDIEDKGHMMSSTQAPAGWYQNPGEDQTKLRYWDGTQWTDQLKDAPASDQAVMQTNDQQQSQSTPAPQQQPPTPYTAQETLYATQEKDNSNFAIASLVLGILGPPLAVVAILGYISGTLAIIFAVKSMKSSKRTMAIVGLVLGIITILFSVLSSIIGVLSVLS